MNINKRKLNAMFYLAKINQDKFKLKLKRVNHLLVYTLYEKEVINDVDEYVIDAFLPIEKVELPILEDNEGNR